MTMWFVAALAMVAMLMPLGVAASKGSPMDRLVVLELASATQTSTLILLAETFGPVVLRVRELHNGHVGDYVAWLTLGLAALGGAFAFVLR